MNDESVGAGGVTYLGDPGQVELLRPGLHGVGGGEPPLPHRGRGEGEPLEGGEAAAGRGGEPPPPHWARGRHHLGEGVQGGGKPPGRGGSGWGPGGPGGGGGGTSWGEGGGEEELGGGGEEARDQMIV